MKQTEIGLIPEDWEVKEIKDFADVTTGDKNTQDAEENGKYPFYVRSPIVERINKFSYDTEGVITAGDGVGTGKVFHYAKGKFGLHQRAYLIYNFKNTDPKYFYYNFSKNFYERVHSMTAKSSVDSVRREMITKMQIPIPPTLAEQERIAKALSDVDALISTTEKLIQKKKNIKQGAMQNLLTGKKRLPGFGPQTKSPAYKQTELGLIPEDWEVKNIKELGVFISGSGFPLIEQGRKNEKYPFFKVSDFNNLGNENKLISASNYVSETVASKLCCKIVKKNSIVFAKIGAAIMLERKRITAYDCCIDNNMMAFTVNSDNDFSYLCYNFQQIPFASLSSSTALPSLSSKIIGNQLISVPLKEEQTAIANVLSSMDKEIETLNTKLEKYRNLKTAMMQQLLTGKIRLNKGVYS